MPNKVVNNRPLRGLDLELQTAARLSGRLLAIFLTSNIAYAEVDLGYLKNIDKLVSEKKYQQALEGHQYFFEESKKS